MYMYVYICLYASSFFIVVFMSAVDSKKLECGLRVSYACFPPLFCFGIRGRSYSNFLATTVYVFLWLHLGLHSC